MSVLGLVVRLVRLSNAKSKQLCSQLRALTRYREQ